MNRQASILFNFISSSISGNWLALQEPTAQRPYYQRLIYTSLSRSIYTTEGFQSLGRQLAEIARHACLARQMEAVEQASQVMRALPISKELKGVAQYHQAICVKRKGDFDGARQLLERVVEEATPEYSARALLTIGATYFDKGQVEASLPFFLSAGRASGERDLLTFAESQKMIAVVRSIYGDHKQALGDLERLFPLVRATGKHYPALYCDYLNSLAVELSEVGRVAEAEAICSTALASPFAAVYPEIAQTRDEIAAKRTAATPSVVAINRAPEPAPVPQSQPERQAKPVCALAFIHPAHDKALIQTSIPIAPAAIAMIGIAQSIRDRTCFCIQPRGPPPHSQRVFGLLPEKPFQAAENTQWAEPIPFIVQCFFAQSQRSTAAIGFGVSSGWHHQACCRSLPLRRAEDESKWPHQLTTQSPFYFSFQPVNHAGEIPELGMNWAGGCVRNRLPRLTARRGGKELNHTHLCAQKGEL